MKKTLLFAAALALAFVIGALSQAPKTSKHRVVFHLNYAHNQRAGRWSLFNDAIRV